MKLQAVRGMNDILPLQALQMHTIEQAARKVFEQYGYQQIVLPIVESTHLFARSVGAVTDIVEKEMYTFEDRNGDSLSLRPEGTAGCVRAGLEHGLFYNQVQRLWYHGPMFRHERPQKGRYRQFFQMGVEAYGLSSPASDAEIILLQYRLWQQLGLANEVRLELNTLGSSESRDAFRAALVAYCESRLQDLDEDSLRRLKTNPLRILDSKNPAMQDVIADAPKIDDYLDEASTQHYQAVKTYLAACGVAYVENPHLVRGMDYYCHTVFEWTSDKLGAQATVSAGGRYDLLVEKLGGRSTPAVGFALGMERLALLMAELGLFEIQPPLVDVYMVMQDDKAVIAQALSVADQLRQKGMRVIADGGEGSFKSQFKKADKSGASIALILGEEELAAGEVTVKYLREDKPQERVSFKQLTDKLAVP